MFDFTGFGTGGKAYPSIDFTTFRADLMFNHNDVAGCTAEFAIVIAVSNVTEFDTVGGGKFDSYLTIFQVVVWTGGEEGNLDVAENNIWTRVGDFNA